MGDVETLTGTHHDALGAIEGRANAATWGPWDCLGDTVYSGAKAVAVCHFFQHKEADARFIAHARQDVLNLAAVVRRLHAELEKAREGVTT